jgi:hypothetical protein
VTSDRADVLDLPRFAAVMAHLRHFPAADRGEVLSRLGLDERAWGAVLASWYAARDAEIARGATDLFRRFGVAFGRARRRLDDEKPSLSSLAPLADAPPPPSPSAEPVRPPAPGPIAPPAPVVAPAVSLAGTLPLGTELPLPSLPFVAARTPAAASSAAPSPPLPFGLGPRRPPGRELAETVGLPPGVGGPAPVPAGVPDLTLPQYASLRVELELAPDQAEAILARYGVTRDGRARLEDYWRGRFEADPLLRMMFAKAYATYVSWLRANRGG